MYFAESIWIQFFQLAGSIYEYQNFPLWNKFKLFICEFITPSYWFHPIFEHCFDYTFQLLVEINLPRITDWGSLPEMRISVVVNLNCLLVLSLYIKVIYKLLNMCPFDYTTVAENGKPYVNHTIWITVVASTDRPTPARNRYVIERYFGVFM